MWQSWQEPSLIPLIHPYHSPFSTKVRQPPQCFTLEKASRINWTRPVASSAASINQKKRKRDQPWKLRNLTSKLTICSLRLMNPRGLPGKISVAPIHLLRGRSHPPTVGIIDLPLRESAPAAGIRRRGWLFPCGQSRWIARRGRFCEGARQPFRVCARCLSATVWGRQDDDCR